MTRMEQREKEQKARRLARRIAIGIVSLGIIINIANQPEIEIPEKEDFVPPNNIEIQIPEKVVIRTETSVYAPDKFYAVKQGDTLRKICAQNGIDPDLTLLLAEYNNLNNQNFIKVGQIIKVPVQDKLIEECVEVLNYNQALLNLNYHILRENETLFSLSKKVYSNYDLSFALGVFNGFKNPNDLLKYTIIYLPEETELLSFYEHNKDYIDQYETEHNHNNSIRL